MSEGALPNLLVIGAMKCGTTSLHHYLGLHPEIQMSRAKELHFFIDEEGFDPAPYITDPREEALFGDFRTWRKGVDWYRGYFDPVAPVRGEGTVAYTFPWYGGVVERIAGLVPEAKLIYVVRDPIDRAVSHYHQFRAGGIEWRSLDDALSTHDNVYLGPTLYGTVLNRFLSRFPREQIHVMRQDDLLTDRRPALESVFRFLGVEPGFWSEEIELQRNRSEVKWRREWMSRRPRLLRALRRVGAARPPERYERPEAGPELRRLLLDRLEPEIAAVEELTGWDLAGWRAPVAAPG